MYDSDYGIVINEESYCIKDPLVNSFITLCYLGGVISNIDVTSDDIVKCMVHECISRSDSYIETPNGRKSLSDLLIAGYDFLEVFMCSYSAICSVLELDPKEDNTKRIIELMKDPTNLSLCFVPMIQHGYKINLDEISSPTFVSCFIDMLISMRISDVSYIYNTMNELRKSYVL